MVSKYTRKPARLFRIKDIYTVEIIKFDDEIRFKLHDLGISRINIFGTVISKYVVEREKEKKFASVTLDDGTATIRVKSWGEIDPIKKVKEGDIVDVIGKLRVFDNEIYVALEKMSPARSVQYELSIRAEHIYDAMSMITADMDEQIPDFVPINISAEEYARRKTAKNKQEQAKIQVLNLLQIDTSISIAQLMKQLMWPKEQVVATLKELHSAGLILEPQTDHFRKI